MSETDQLQAIVNRIDEANSKDPNQDYDLEGNHRPKEWLYGQRMTKELLAFDSSPSVALQIAARAQHIERWTSPRSDYPEGRTGYKKWRAELGLFHATRTAELMLEAGYSQAEQDAVKSLLQKRQLKRNPETQALEDVICIVFLKYYFAPFAKKHDEAKLIDIVQKTWAKMSEKGHQHALQLSLPDHLGTLINKAVSE